MRELAERADVSLRTLYNAFGSKEALIAAAVRQYYDRFFKSVSEGRNLYSFDWVLSGIVATNLRNQQIREYLTSLVNLYFSVSADTAIRIELRRIASGFMTPWLELLQARHQLRLGTDITRTTRHIASLQYAINQEWLGGEIPDDAFVPAVVEAVLTYLAGIVREEAYDLVENEIVDLSRGGARLARVISAEKMFIDNMLQGPGELWPVGVVTLTA